MSELPLSRKERERALRESEIVDAAERLFAEKGFDGVSMDEIAAESQFTKRTLYQYFANKEELYFAVVLRVMKCMSAAFETAPSQKGSAFSKIEKLCNRFYEYVRDHKHHIELISGWGYVKKRSGESKRKEELTIFNGELFASLSVLIASGKKDGSIAMHVDPKNTAFSLTFLMTGFLNQLAVSGETFTSNFGLILDKFAASTIAMILSSIKK